jgi:hypothetical protein
MRPRGLVHFKILRRSRPAWSACSRQSMASRTRATHVSLLSRPGAPGPVSGQLYGQHQPAVRGTGGRYYTCVNSYPAAPELAYILSDSSSELLITSRAGQEVALEAQERENLLITHPEIAAAAVFGVPITGLGRRPAVRRLADRVERPPGPAPRRRRSGVKASPFGTQDRHDPERAGVLRPAPARAARPWARRPRPMALDMLIIRVPRLTWFAVHIVLRYGEEGAAVTCACRRRPG